MPRSIITEETVKKIAELTNLKLTEDEVKKFADYFTDTLVYMDMLNELDTQNCLETYQVTGLTNIFQSGSVVESLTVDKALANASDRIGDYFGTKQVLDKS